MQSNIRNLRSIFRFLMPLMLGQVASFTVQGNADERPNIIFAFADDLGCHAGVYGKLEPGGINDVVRTPNIDRLAEQGVTFRHAFVNAPSCTPCRSSLVSGQHFWRTGRGAILHNAQWDDTIPAFPLLLRDAGYHVGYSYKVWSPGIPVDAPIGGKPSRYQVRNARLNAFSQFVDKQEDALSAKQQLFTEVRQNFSMFLQARATDQPFFYWFGPTNCHRKWEAGSGQRLWGIDPDNLEGKLPPFLPDVPAIREDVADYLGEAAAFDAAVGVLLEQLEQTGEADNTIVVVSGDHGAPGFTHGKCTLYDFGTRVPLIIRWPEGIAASETGSRILEDFASLPDLAPTFLEAAGAPIPKVMTARSLMATITAAWPATSPGNDGEDDDGWNDRTRDAVFIGRERHVSLARKDFKPYPQRAIRTPGCLYIRNFKPERWPLGIGPGYGQPDAEMPSYESLRDSTYAAFPDIDAGPTKAWILSNLDYDDGKYVDFLVGRVPAEELYVMADDPYQINNRADDPQFADVKARLRERLMAELRTTGDPRVVQEDPMYEHPPYAAPFKRTPKRRATTTTPSG